MCEGMFTMFDLDPAVLNAFIALIGVLLLVFAWRSVSGLPALARWGLRLVLTAIIVAPFAALILYPPAMQEARAPTDRDRAAPSARVEPEQPLQPETDVGERAGDDATARKQADEAGVKLPPGYTWVNEFTRGSKISDEVKLRFDKDGNLTEETLFSPPSRATVDLRRLLSA